MLDGLNSCAFLEWSCKGGRVIYLIIAGLMTGQKAYTRGEGLASTDMPGAAAVANNETMEVDSEDFEDDDIQEDIERFRQERKATRTLYHQRRADDDTM